MTQDPKCQDCRFADPISAMSGTVIRYSCRRLPPHPSSYESPYPDHQTGYDDRLLGRWPSVSLHDWCGEFQPKATP